MPWVLDIDVTVKPLYGKQEGAVLGYNPAKPGRPSHAYHSFWVGHLRLCLGVQVCPGNEISGSFGLEPLMQWLERTPRARWPEFVRGDIGYGTQTWMLELEARGLGYLFKLKQSKKVKDLIALCELMARLIALIYNWWSIHQSVRTLVIFCAHTQAKEIQRNLEQAAERLKSWASLTSGQLKKSSVWSQVIAHILLHHQTIGAGKTRAPPALCAAQ